MLNISGNHKKINEKRYIFLKLAVCGQSRCIKQTSAEIL